MIELEAVSKQIAGRTILDRLSFCVGRGRVLAILGHNGAGKTSAIRLMTGLWKPSAGRVRVGGVEMAGQPERGRRLLGVVPSEASLYESLTAWENIRLFSGYFGDAGRAESRARALMADLGIDGVMNRPAGQLSKGMKQKVAIVRALAHKPEVLILDEPTTGLDIGATDALERLIAAHHQAGGTIVLCTHDMHQALRLADQVLVLAGGRGCWQGTRQEIPTADWLANLVLRAGREGGITSGALDQLAAMAGGAAASTAADLP